VAEHEVPQREANQPTRSAGTPAERRISTDIAPVRSVLGSAVKVPATKEIWKLALCRPAKTDVTDPPHFRNPGILRGASPAGPPDYFGGERNITGA
jgi:hypothetical protein